MSNIVYADNSDIATNLPIASFTTAHSTMKLYKLLDAVDNRVLYCDTDSCVFVSKDCEHVPETGLFLSDLTDEIDEGMSADSFVCTSPKYYAVKLENPNGEFDHIVKTKDLTLNKTTAGIMNFKAMMKIVLDKINKPADAEEGD